MKWHRKVFNDFLINYRKTAGNIQGASAFWWLNLPLRHCGKYNQPDQTLYCRHIGGCRLAAIWLICSGTVEKSLNNDSISAVRLGIRWPLVQEDIMHNDETWLMHIQHPISSPQRAFQNPDIVQCPAYHTC